MKKEQIEPFFARLKAANPQPNTELEYTSVFELLTAVLLSAQDTDVGVNKPHDDCLPWPTHRKPFWIWAYPRLKRIFKPLDCFAAKPST